MEGLKEEEKKIISFCIPTYNRAEKVYKLVTEILKYNGNDIEVIVNDNYSTDNTKTLLLSISDNRFRFYENTTNEGHLLNGIKVMSLAQGDYVFFCLDKDYITHDYISKMVDLLKINTEIAVGYVKLNLTRESKPEIFNKGFDSLKRLAYTGKHPTGYFCKNDYLRSLDILKRFSNDRKTGGFLFDFIVTELCLFGKTAIVSFPFCFTEKLEEAKKSKSYTYSEAKENIFFFPKQRYYMFENYVIHLETLPTNAKVRKLLLKKILRQTLLNITIVFKQIMKDKDICEHYYVKSKKVSWNEVIKNDLEFSHNFINNCIYKNKFKRSILIIEAHFLLSLKLCLKLIKKAFDNLCKERI